MTDGYLRKRTTLEGKYKDNLESCKDMLKMEMIGENINSNIGKIDFENLGFGEIFTDHMFSMEYKNGEWILPSIIPFGKMEILPSLCSLHYGQIVFEGLMHFVLKKV